MVTVRELTTIEPGHLTQLSGLLVAVVGDGASVGFLPPLATAEAEDYWRGVVKPNVRLLVAEEDGEIVGTAQLELATKFNGRHRAEVNKVLVHPRAQRRGIGRQLMLDLERVARDEGRTLLHLDTRDGDPSNKLYLSVGYAVAGTIPSFARSASGSLDATVIYYKLLDERNG
jgi:GNAT superfamily N-acetyltransferase